MSLQCGFSGPPSICGGSPLEKRAAEEGKQGKQLLPHLKTWRSKHIFLLLQKSSGGPARGPFGKSPMFLESLRLSPRTPIWQRRVSKRSMSLPQSKVEWLTIGYRDFPPIEGSSVPSRELPVYQRGTPPVRGAYHRPKRALCRS